MLFQPYSEGVDSPLSIPFSQVARPDEARRFMNLETAGEGSTTVLLPDLTRVPLSRITKQGSHLFKLHLVYPPGGSATFIGSLEHLWKAIPTIWRRHHLPVQSRSGLGALVGAVRGYAAYSEQVPSCLLIGATEVLALRRRSASVSVTPFQCSFLCCLTLVFTV